MRTGCLEIERHDGLDHPFDVVFGEPRVQWQPDELVGEALSYRARVRWIGQGRPEGAGRQAAEVPGDLDSRSGAVLDQRPSVLRLRQQQPKQMSGVI